MKSNWCETCHGLIDRECQHGRYCSNACKQKAYRMRKAGNKPVRKTCPRCGTSSRGGVYCSSTCKVLANREKHHATWRTFKALFPKKEYDLWYDLDGHWKDAYAKLETMGYKYSIPKGRWVSPDQTLMELEVEE